MERQEGESDISECTAARSFRTKKSVAALDFNIKKKNLEQESRKVAIQPERVMGKGRGDDKYSNA